MAVAIAALLTTPAEARELTQRERAQVQDVASNVMPGTRCYGQVRILWQHDVQTPPGDTDVDQIHKLGLDVAGYAYGAVNDSCDVGIRTDYTPQQACTIGVHERMHLVATRFDDETQSMVDVPTAPHHGDGSPIMGNEYGQIATGYIWPGCVSMIWLRQDEAQAFMWDRFGMADCVRKTASRFQCVGVNVGKLRHGKRKRFRQVWRVWLDEKGMQGKPVT